jgi:hypothetical protein
MHKWEGVSSKRMTMNIPDESVDSELEKDPLDEAAPAHDSIIRWKIVLFVLGTLISMAVVWISSSSRFDIPPDIRRDRAIYVLARQQYSDDPHYWYCQWAHLEYTIRQMLRQGREQDLPTILVRVTPQALMAFLVNHANAKVEHLKNVATVPRVHGSSFMISISKPEPNSWPLTTMLSVELHVTFEPEGPSLRAARLRRGSQELPPSLAWLYFSIELERLMALSKRDLTSQ